MTPMQLADELETFKLTPHTPQLNPSRKGLRDVALGRVTIEYNGKSRTVAPGSRSPRSLKKFLVRIVDPSMNLNACRSNRAKQILEGLIGEMQRLANESVKAADLSKMQDRVLKAEQKKLDQRRRAFIADSREVVRAAFRKYHEVLDEGIIMDLWKEAVVQGVLES